MARWFVGGIRLDAGYVADRLSSGCSVLGLMIIYSWPLCLKKIARSLLRFIKAILSE